MAYHVRAPSVPQTEKDYYNLIKANLKQPTEDSVAKAQEIYDRALEDCVWESPLGNSGCSYDSYVKSDGNYAVAAQKAINAAKQALSNSINE